MDRQVLKDYLALKYLCNAIHGRAREHENDWLHARGFPSDHRELTTEHLDKIENVHENPMFALLLLCPSYADIPRFATPFKLTQSATRRKDDTGILRIGDLERIIWNHLQRIDAHIHAAIQRTVLRGCDKTLFFETLGVSRQRRKGTTLAASVFQAC